MSNEHTEKSLQKFRARIEFERRICDEVAEDVGTLMHVGALDSFVETFTDGYDQLFDLIRDRLIQGDVRFSKQVESSSDPLEYTGSTAGRSPSTASWSLSGSWTWCSESSRTRAARSGSSHDVAPGSTIVRNKNFVSSY